MSKTFKIGGVHPEGNKLTAGSTIEILPLPETVSIPVSQHIGAPAKVLVKPKDVVKAGTKIAESGGFVSANIHSSVSGVVKKIDTVYDASGYKRQAIIINVEGDEWEESINRSEQIVKEITLSKQEILDRINSGGLVGLGGATFPTHVKLMVPEGKKAQVLLINGVECEPYLTADHRLMLEKKHQLMIGVRILMMALGVDKAAIGIENNKPDAIQALRKISVEYPGIDIVPLKVKYPQGGEKQLIKAVMNREVPSGKLPIEVGAVVQNVGTAYAVYEIVQKNKPLFERVVTVTGKSVARPGNFLVRIGTPISNLIDAVGGLPSDTGKVVSGGPMMGKALNNLSAPVTKGTSGVLIFKEREAHRKAYEACIRCGKCVTACPMGIEPYLLMNYAEQKKWVECETSNIMDCIECGSCSFTCPAYRPLLDFIRLGKSNVNQIMRQRKR